MKAKPNLISDLEELDELLAESTQAGEADDLDDLEDLDALLAESTALAAAKRAQKQGRKLTAEQSELLEANRLAAEMLVWEERWAVAHFIHTTCTCGSQHLRFSGWYRLLEHRRQNSRRLVRYPDHGGLPASQHTTQEHVAYCHECLGSAGLPPADLKAHPILSSLGEPLAQDRGQLELVLLAAEARGDAILAELDGGNDKENFDETV